MIFQLLKDKQDNNLDDNYSNTYDHRQEDLFDITRDIRGAWYHTDLEDS